MSQPQIDALVASYLNAQLHDAAQREALIDDPVARDQRGFDIAGELQAITGAIQRGDLNGYVPHARSLLKTEDDEPRIRALARRLADAHREGLIAELNALRGDPIRRPNDSSSIPSAGIEPAHTNGTEPTGAALSVVIHEYAETKRIGGKWTPKTARINKYILDAVIELLGDKPMRGSPRRTGAVCTDCCHRSPRTPPSATLARLCARQSRWRTPRTTQSACRPSQ